MRISRTQLVRQGNPATCRKHGEHSDWAIVSKSGGRYARCRKCNRELQQQAHAGRRDILSKQRAERKKLKPVQYYLGPLRHRAKKLGRQYDLSCEWVETQLKIQQYKCYLSGVPIDFDNISIDRVDPDKGYTMDNCKIAHRKLNFMKLDFQLAEFVEYCTKVVATHGSN